MFKSPGMAEARGFLLVCRSAVQLFCFARLCTVLFALEVSCMALLLQHACPQPACAQAHCICPRMHSFCSSSSHGQRTEDGGAPSS